MLSQVRKATNASYYDLVYPASLNWGPFFIGFPGIVPYSQDEGASDLAAYLQASLQSCPNQNYALIGYSQGAEVINRALINITSKSNAALWNRIKAIVYVGNPSHSANKASNFDQKGGNSTQAYNGTGMYPGKTAPLTAYINANKLHDICAAGDNVCAQGMPDPGPAFPPTDYHGSYETSQAVQDQGASFIISKLPV